jgi:hypothetical protein
MESVVRNVVEPFFETILKRLTELDKKIITLDTKMTKMENEVLVLGCKLETKLLTTSLDSSNCKMEDVD